MKKSLSQMTLEELWQLFPIILTEHKSEWMSWFDSEQRRICKFLPKESIVRISHIGSTSIPKIWAKPIIDILLEVKHDASMEEVAMLLMQNGYTCMNQDTSRMDLNQGYTVDGVAERVYHLHIRYEGDHDELYFRDYLREHPEVAREYEQLKLSLWKLYEHDRDGYTEAKTEFVRKYTDIARKLQE